MSIKTGNPAGLQSPLSVLFAGAIVIFLLSCGSDLGGGSGQTGTITITGAIRYEDREYDADGFTGTTVMKAVRFTRVEIVESSTGAVRASGNTDSGGGYSIAISNATTAYVRVISDTSSSGGPLVSVYSPTSNALYSVRGADVTFSGSQSIDLSIPVVSSAAGAFNILDVYTSGSLFIYSLAGSYPPQLKAYWRQGSEEGTYYCTGFCLRGEGIYILGGTTQQGGDTDEYDDDVLLHEFGHFIADKFSKDDSPGGLHSHTDNDLDLRLSWSEGWGNFFLGAAKTWIRNNQADLLSAPALSNATYIDTIDGLAAITFDFADPAPQSGADPYIYSSNEVAVAKVLLEAMELSSGIQNIWNVFDVYLPDVATPVNIEAFWDGWLSNSYPDLTSTFEERRIYYKPDSYESDDTPSSSRKYTAPETHYLYSASGADKDVIAFDAVAGGITIETYTLANGADTYLRLLGMNGTTVLAENDDTRNSSGGDFFSNNYASKITNSVSAAGTYYIEVSTAPDTAVEAGRYGTYTLKITQP